MPNKILILFAHPVLERSRVNRRLLEAVEGLPGVTVHDLYERYPTLNIDVEYEQALLLEHDIYVFQHPFYWYSAPAIVKEWQDLVLEHGWAYGREGRQLVGKVTFNAITTGGPASAYRPEGYNRFTIRELLSPYDQTANLCGMRYLAPFVVHAALRLSTDSEVAPHGVAYRAVLEQLREGALDLDRAERAATLNELVAGAGMERVS
jgi:glutathione-regulated potassium-efflux system ancillary protein KefG